MQEVYKKETKWVKQKKIEKDAYTKDKSEKRNKGRGGGGGVKGDF